MNILITERQKKMILETVTNKEAICDKCGHDNSDEDYRGKRVMVYYNLHKHAFSVTI